MLDNNDRKIIIVLKSIFEGIPVKLGGVEYNLCDNYELCVQLKKVSNGKEEVIYSKVDIPASEFFRMCTELTDDEVASIASNITVKAFRNE